MAPYAKMNVLTYGIYKHLLSKAANDTFFFFLSGGFGIRAKSHPESFSSINKTSLFCQDFLTKDKFHKVAFNIDKK
jgi:hypothetical protein